MNGLAFVASLVHSLAWPAGAVVSVTILRRPIGAALGRGVRRVRAGPLEVEFDHELAVVREELRRIPELAEATPPPLLQGSLVEELSRLADASPRAAVLEAFGRIEARLADMLFPQGPESAGDLARWLMGLGGGSSGRLLARQAHDRGLISDETLAAVEGLSVLRNLAAHSPTDTISVDRARDYLALADAVLYALKAKPASDPSSARGMAWVSTGA